MYTRSYTGRRIIRKSGQREEGVMQASHYFKPELSCYVRDMMTEITT